MFDSPKFTTKQTNKIQGIVHVHHRYRWIYLLTSFTAANTWQVMSEVIEVTEISIFTIREFDTLVMGQVAVGRYRQKMEIIRPKKFYRSTRENSTQPCFLLFHLNLASFSTRYLLSLKHYMYVSMTMDVK